MLADATNLYGWAQLQALPHRNYAFMNDNDILLFKSYFDRRSLDIKMKAPLSDYKDFFNNYFEDSEEDLNADCGEEMMYFMECDFKYSPHLHDLFSDYPPAPHKYSVEDSATSEIVQSLKTKQYFKPSKNGESSKRNPPKLCATLLDKKKYVILFKNLELLSSLGVEITK